MAPEGSCCYKGKTVPLNQRDLKGVVQVWTILAIWKNAVLAVGSNRAPYQLLRKFGSEAIVPVTSAQLRDCDVSAHGLCQLLRSNTLYCFSSLGTITELKVVWLDEDQLLQIHKTGGLRLRAIVFNAGCGTPTRSTS